MGESKVSDDGAYEVFFYAYNDILKPEQTTESLFKNEKIEFVNMLEGQLELDSEWKIPINAYAIQTGSLNETGETQTEKIINAFEQYKAQEEIDNND